MTILHISPIATGNLLFILNIGFVAGPPIGGFLSDRIIRSRKKIIIAGLILMALSSLALALYQHTHLVWPGLIFFLWALVARFAR